MVDIARNLNDKLLKKIEKYDPLKLYREKISNRKTHIFHGNLEAFKASIYAGISKQRARGWKPTVKQDQEVTAAITEYLHNMYTAISSTSNSKVFSYRLIGGTATNFTGAITGEGVVEGHLQLLRNKAGIGKVSNRVKAIFSVTEKNITIDLGHMDESTIASQYATSMLSKFDSRGKIPADLKAYEELKTYINYDPVGAKLATIKVEDQFYSINQGTTDEAKISGLLSQALGEFVREESLHFLQPYANVKLNDLLEVSAKAGAKTSKKLPVSRSGRSQGKKIIKHKTGKVTEATESLNVDVGAAPVQQNWLSLLPIININLPIKVMANMTAPSLVNRTGRFASSAQVTSVDYSKNGDPIFVFDYERDPYNVFDKTVGRSPWNTPERDPRALVDRSLREIVKELAVNRFYTRRAKW